MERTPEKCSLDELLAALCDGDVPDATIRQVGLRLGDDPAARQQYLDYLLIHGLLQWDYGSLSAAGAARTGSPPGADRRRGTPILGFLGSALADGLAAIEQAPSSFWLLVATAIASSAITAAVIGWTRVPVATPQAGEASSPAPSFANDEVRPERPPPGAEFVATLVGAAGARWAGAAAMADGTRLPAGDVRLTEGLAEIVFDGGAKVVLEGPARFVPQSSRGGMLHYGRLVAHLPPDSAPFAVQTAMAVISARGGEFAVECASSGQTRLHVYAGVAEVAGRTRNTTEMPHSRVAAGEALLVEPAADAQLLPLTPQGDRFVRDISGPPRHFPAGLVSYWSFDEQGGPAFDKQGQNHGLLGSVRRSAGLLGKGSVAFDDRRGQQVTIDASPDFEFADGLTLEALFVSHWNGEWLNYDEILRTENGDRRILLALQHDSLGTHDHDLAGDESGFAPQPVLSFGCNIGGRYTELDVPLDGREGRPTLADVTDGQVHHVVATYDAASGLKALYLDGTLRFSRQFAPGTPIVSGGTSPLTIGNMYGGWETFNGLIDEVAIYRRALSADEIATHWQNVQRKKSYFELPTTPPPPDSI